MCSPPMLSRCGVSNWQSISPAPAFSMVRARNISASFEAEGRNENMLSPKNDPPSVTP